MPVLPERNALFIHIPKNAGRSIEAALLPSGIASTSGRRSLPNRAAHLAQTLTANAIAQRYLVGTLDASLCAQHLTLAEIELLGLLPGGSRAGLFTFCVVRNPYARALSSLRHFRKRFVGQYDLDRHPEPAQIERALEVWAALVPADHNLRAHRRPQADFVFSRGRDNAMDMVLRFERLEADFARLTARLGLPETRLPWIGRATGPDADIAALYTPRARRIVEELYGADLELFGYSFPGGQG